MKLAALSERLMAMSDETWARHANPWSAWSRLTTLPLIGLAVYSRIWLGWWALIPVALTLFWLWLNPRLFAPPRRHDAWMTRGVFGERVWLRRAEEPIPRRYVRPGQILSGLSALGFLAFVYGLWRLEIWWTLGGLAVSMIAKLILVRMLAALYDEVSGRA